MDDLAQLVDPFHPGMLAGDDPGPVELVGQDGVKDLVDQGGLAGPGYAGDGGHDP